MIEITQKQLLTLDPIAGSYSAYQAGDDINNTYFRIDLSSGLIFYVCGWWSSEEVKSEIDSALAAEQARQDNKAAEAAQLQETLDSL